MKRTGKGLTKMFLFGLFLTWILLLHPNGFSQNSSSNTLSSGTPRQSAIPYVVEGTLSTNLEISLDQGFHEFRTTLGWSLSPSLRNQSGLTIGTGVSVFNTSGDLAIAPALTDFHYRFVLTRTPIIASTDQPQLSQNTEPGLAPVRQNSTLISLSLGRVSREDVLGIFSPVIVDGLRFSGSNQVLELDLIIGYQGFLFNNPESLAYGDNLRFLQNPTNQDPDLLPISSVWNQELPGPWIITPHPSLLLADLRLVLPEVIGRQNLFISGGYVQTLDSTTPLTSSANIFHGYGLAGATGPFSTRSFYTMAVGVSHLVLPGVQEAGSTGLGILANLRTYLPGQFGPRIGFTGFASTSDFLLPNQIQINPGFQGILESAAWFTSIDLEGVLIRSPVSPRLGLSWNGSVFGTGKTSTGPGLLTNSSLLDVTGIYSIGGALGLRYRPLRDLLVTIDSSTQAPVNPDLGQFTFQANLGLTWSY